MDGRRPGGEGSEVTDDEGNRGGGVTLTARNEGLRRFKGGQRSSGVNYTSLTASILYDNIDKKYTTILII